MMARARLNRPVILNFTKGASNVLAQECYRVKEQPNLRVHQLEIRKKDDWSAPTELLEGVSKFELHMVERSRLLNVTTKTSITGGAKATHGWIEEKFRGARTTCFLAVRPFGSRPGK
jgi:hypothetical protein